jgi:hypothetical protein
MLNYSTACLIRNILNYVEAQAFVDGEDDITHLSRLLGNAIFSQGVSLCENKIRANVSVNPE